MPGFPIKINLKQNLKKKKDNSYFKPEMDIVAQYVKLPPAWLASYMGVHLSLRYSASNPVP